MRKSNRVIINNEINAWEKKTNDIWKMNACERSLILLIDWLISILVKIEMCIIIVPWDQGQCPWPHARRKSENWGFETLNV